MMILGPRVSYVVSEKAGKSPPLAFLYLIPFDTEASRQKQECTLTPRWVALIQNLYVKFLQGKKLRISIVVTTEVKYMSI